MSMKLKLLIFLALIILVIIDPSQQRQKKKKPKKKKAAKNPLDKRPDKIKPELYCDACQAIVKEAVKELRGKKRESDVMAYLERVCDPEKYYVYSHPPPEMREGCEAFIDGWEEELEKVLINRENDEKPIQQLCYEITRACNNVDPTNVKPFDDQIWFDGQPKKLKDGKIVNEEEEEEDL